MSDDDDEGGLPFPMDEDDDNDEGQDDFVSPSQRALELHYRENAVEGEDNTFHAQRLRPPAAAPARPRRDEQHEAVERDQLIPFQRPEQDPREMPVQYVVTDKVAFYGNVSLVLLLYARATTGAVPPVLYDTERGAL